MIKKPPKLLLNPQKCLLFFYFRVFLAWSVSSVSFFFKLTRAALQKKNIIYLLNTHRVVFSCGVVRLAYFFCTTHYSRIIYQNYASALLLLIIFWQLYLYIASPCYSYLLHSSSFNTPTTEWIAGLYY